MHTRFVANFRRKCAMPYFLAIAAFLVSGIAFGVLLAAGALTAVAPTGASAFVPISITGTGFDPTAAKNEMQFLAVNGATFIAVGTAITTLDAAAGRRRLTARVPAGTPAGSARVSIRNLTTGEVIASIGL